MSWWVRWFGLILGAISVFSLIHEHWHFNLHALAVQMVEFYRAMLYPPIELFEWIFHVDVQADAIVLWFLLGTSLFRFVFEDGHKVMGYWTIYGFCIFVGLWPLILMLMVLTKNLSGLIRWCREILNVVAAAIVFFALNFGAT